MGRFLNPGNEMFHKSLRDELYVDKTGFIGYTNGLIGKKDCHLCVSRPRRFGKTVTADMLCAYYDRSADSRTLFAGRAASSLPSFEEHLNRYDVIHLNIADFLTRSKDIEDFLMLMSRFLRTEIIHAYPDVLWLDSDDLASVLEDAYATTRAAFVFVIDEWDAVFRVHRDDKAAQTRYLDWLRYLLKDKSYVALSYMTGILPIKKYGQHSALNMFQERSMVDASPVQAYTGFTEADVTWLSEAFGAPLERMRDWYDGYEVDGVSIYNPRSVIESIRTGKVSNYWTKTETFEALRVYIEMNMDGLREKVVRLVAGERVDVNTATFQNDMVTLGSADDVLTLLVHLGYLTFCGGEGEDAARGQVWIPNREVAAEFVSCIESRGWEEVARAIEGSEQLLTAALDGRAEDVARMLARAHVEVASALTYNDENSLACALSLAFYTARRRYKLVRKLPAGVGFADIVCLPKPGADVPPLLLELKRRGSSGSAIDQIHARGYVQGVEGLCGEVVLVGASYDAEDPNKPHECSIERVALHG